MNQPLIKVPPTKSTLLNLKQRLRLLEEGHGLLERKRELLTRLVYQRIGDYRDIKRSAQRRVQQAYQWLSLAQLRMGARALRQAALGVSYNFV